LRREPAAMGAGCDSPCIGHLVYRRVGRQYRNARYREDLAVQVAEIQWVINAYTLSLSSFLLIAGAAGDQFGRRRIFIVGVAIFAVASVYCGFASNIVLLIGARAVQGIGAALLIPCSLAISGASFPEAERGRRSELGRGFPQSRLRSVHCWIVDYLTWQAVFLINPFLAIPVIWIAWRHLPESYDPTAPQVWTGRARCLFWEVWAASHSDSLLCQTPGRKVYRLLPRWCSASFYSPHSFGTKAEPGRR
jgi:MFS family permease